MTSSQIVYVTGLKYTRTEFGTRVRWYDEHNLPIGEPRLGELEASYNMKMYSNHLKKGQ